MKISTLTVLGVLFFTVEGRSIIIDGGEEQSRKKDDSNPIENFEEEYTRLISASAKRGKDMVDKMSTALDRSVIMSRPQVRKHSEDSEKRLEKQEIECTELFQPNLRKLKDDSLKGLNMCESAGASNVEYYWAVVQRDTDKFRQQLNTIVNITKGCGQKSSSASRCVALKIYDYKKVFEETLQTIDGVANQSLNIMDYIKAVSQCTVNLNTKAQSEVDVILDTTYSCAGKDKTLKSKNGIKNQTFLFYSEIYPQNFEWMDKKGIECIEFVKPNLEKLDEKILEGFEKCRLEGIKRTHYHWVILQQNVDVFQNQLVTIINLSKECTRSPSTEAKCNSLEYSKATNGIAETVDIVNEEIINIMDYLKAVNQCTIHLNVKTQTEIETIFDNADNCIWNSKEKTSRINYFKKIVKVNI